VNGLLVVAGLLLTAYQLAGFAGLLGNS
jgi:hypothetical protein